MTSMIVALVSLALAVVLAFRNKIVMAIVLSLIGALALMVAFPVLLSSETINVPHYVPWIVALVGLVLALASKAIEKVPTLLVVLGIFLLIWGICRSFPTVPPAFETFGINSKTAMDATWFALKTLFMDLIPG